MYPVKRRRIRAVSPCASLRALEELLSTSVPKEVFSYVTDKETLDDVCSVTAESGLIMSRSSPRLEFASYLRQHKYLECLKLEQRNLHTQLLRAMILYRMTKRIDLRSRRRIKKRSILRRRSRRSQQMWLQFQYAMMVYQQSFISYSQCSMFVWSLLSERYLGGRLPLQKSLLWLTEILPNSPDSTFQQHTRMTRRSFGMLLHVLQTKAPHYFRSRRGRKQLPISTQLHLALFTLGFYGNGANFESACVKFGCGVATVFNARRRVINAITSLTAEYIKWPSAAQRRELCAEVKRKYGFHSAFFAADGTTHPFAFVPTYQRSSWYDRKSRYSMQALVTNDINLRVIHLVVGWPGSAHDARVLGSADYMLARNEADYFTSEQHGLGDAAFGLHKRVVPNYKDPLASIPENTEYNRCHSSFRVKSEHTLGHVKSRFQGLREVRMKLRNRQEVLEIVKFITAGYVLHNMLLDFNDEYHGNSNAWDRAEWENGAENDDDVNDIPSDDIDADSTAAQFRERVKDQVLSFHGYH